MKRLKLRLGKGFQPVLGNARSQAAQMTLAVGETEGGKDNHHQGADQWLYVVTGRGQIIVEGQRYPLTPQTLVLIERGENHEIRNTGTTVLRTISIYVPPAYTQNGNPLPAGKAAK